MHLVPAGASTMKEQKNSLFAAIVESLSQPLLVLNVDLRVVMANDAFFRWFEVGSEETVGRPVYELGKGQWNIPELRRLLEGNPTCRALEAEMLIPPGRSGFGSRGRGLRVSSPCFARP